MNWTNASKWLILVLPLITACRYKSTDSLLEGRWMTESITQADTVFMPVINGDFLALKSDKTFHYELQKVNKIKKGKWKSESQNLILTYLPESETRSFRITFLSDDKLVFTEKEVVFTYSRQP